VKLCQSDLAFLVLVGHIESVKNVCDSLLITQSATVVSVTSVVTVLLLMDDVGILQSIPGGRHVPTENRW
jgi:hypothetical protein